MRPTLLRGLETISRTWGLQNLTWSFLTSSINRYLRTYRRQNNWENGCRGYRTVTTDFPLIHSTDISGNPYVHTKQTCYKLNQVHKNILHQNMNWIFISLPEPQCWAPLRNVCLFIYYIPVDSSDIQTAMCVRWVSLCQRCLCSYPRLKLRTTTLITIPRNLYL